MKRRPLTGQGGPKTPFVAFKQKVGSKLVGQLLDGPREVKFKRGIGTIYEFAVEECTAPLLVRNESGQLQEVDVAKGDTVSVFAPTVLAKAMRQAKIGELVEIVYNGLKRGRNSEYHDYVVCVLEEDEIA